MIFLSNDADMYGNNRQKDPIALVILQQDAAAGRKRQRPFFTIIQPVHHAQADEMI